MGIEWIRAACWHEACTKLRKDASLKQNVSALVKSYGSLASAKYFFFEMFFGICCACLVCASFFVLPYFCSFASFHPHRKH